MERLKNFMKKWYYIEQKYIIDNKTKISDLLEKLSQRRIMTMY